MSNTLWLVSHYNRWDSYWPVIKGHFSPTNWRVTKKTTSTARIVARVLRPKRNARATFHILFTALSDKCKLASERARACHTIWLILPLADKQTSFPSPLSPVNLLASKQGWNLSLDGKTSVWHWNVTQPHTQARPLAPVLFVESPHTNWHPGHWDRKVSACEPGTKWCETKWERERERFKTATSTLCTGIKNKNVYRLYRVIINSPGDRWWRWFAISS